MNWTMILRPYLTSCMSGRIGLFSVAINWYNILNSKVDISIEDVQILIKSSLSTKYDREEEEQRAQELKRERLERAETLHDVPGEFSSFIKHDQNVYIHSCSRG